MMLKETLVFILFECLICMAQNCPPMGYMQPMPIDSNSPQYDQFIYARAPAKYEQQCYQFICAPASAEYEQQYNENYFGAQGPQSPDIVNQNEQHHADQQIVGSPVVDLLRPSQALDGLHETTINVVFGKDTNHKSVVTPYNTQRNGYEQHAVPLHTNQAVFNRYPQMHASTSTPFARSHDPLKPCSDEEFECTSIHQCIEKGKLCDGHVHCVDGTDEEGCSCVSKLDPKKICDNYVDCPDGDDEVACNGCDRDSYSCYSDMQNECYSKINKCNSIEECSNGEDERNCLLLTPYRTSTINPFVRSTEGILYRNVKNTWYPVCTDISSTYTRIVCEQELGIEAQSANIAHEPTTYDGKYVSLVGELVIKFVNKCLENGMESTNHFVHVKCPNRCGVVTASTNRARIAGGKDALGESHPWMVGIYLNGTFVCAGSIVRSRSILTAAHCVHHQGIRLTNYDYLEVRAGFIRQRSYSPYEQNIRVMRVVIHPNYSAKRYKNDIAVLQLSDPLFFNRWVKPICLQSMTLIGNGTDENWMWKPDVNSICSTAGWGGFTDRGPYPVENLVELELPIVSNCVLDNANVTCAGYPNGGYDACTGDSGGALQCRSDTNRNEFYLAGITSAGYDSTKDKHSEIFCGEPNSVTAFTKPSFYLDWIKKARHEKEDDDIWPTQLCPGIICRTNNRCVKAYDGIVDCMHGEDEVKKL